MKRTPFLLTPKGRERQTANSQTVPVTSTAVDLPEETNEPAEAEPYTGSLRFSVIAAAGKIGRATSKERV